MAVTACHPVPQDVPVGARDPGELESGLEESPSSPPVDTLGPDDAIVPPGTGEAETLHQRNTQAPAVGRLLITDRALSLAPPRGGRVSALRR